MKLRLLTLALAVLPARAQRAQVTPADLAETLAKWENIAKPGRVLLAQSPVLAVSPETLDRIEKALAIGDKEIVIGLAKQGAVLQLTGPVPLRLIGEVDRLCVAFRQLAVPCSSSADTIRETYRNLLASSTPAARRREPADRQAHLDRIAAAFAKHDITEWLKDSLAHVRVIEGEHAGEEGWIRLRELQPVE